ncbi:hypothetical protein TNCV_182471 [Trichonephila clavipes]|nr:hypothetical protein TNCV_182471 [Trichonephila clavipes]
MCQWVTLVRWIMGHLRYGKCFPNQVTASRSIIVNILMPVRMLTICNGKSMGYPIGRAIVFWIESFFL